MPNLHLNSKTISQLQAQITQLKQEKKQMRLFLHELTEAFYKTVNKTSVQEADLEQTCLAPSLQTFKELKAGLKPCANCLENKPCEFSLPKLKEENHE